MTTILVANDDGDVRGVSARAVRYRVPRAGLPWLVAAVAAVIGSGAGGDVSGADASSAPRFQGKAVGNSPSGGRVAKKSFPIGAGYGLYFRDNKRSRTRYRLCAVFEGRVRGCVNGRTGRRGRDSMKFSADVFNPQSMGRLTWRWTVNGRTAATWTVSITQGD